MAAAGAGDSQLEAGFSAPVLDSRPRPPHGEEGSRDSRKPASRFFNSLARRRDQILTPDHLRAPAPEPGKPRITGPSFFSSLLCLWENVDGIAVIDDARPQKPDGDSFDSASPFGSPLTPPPQSAPALHWLESPPPLMRPSAASDGSQPHVIVVCHVHPSVCP